MEIFAQNGLIIVLSFFLIFHILVLFKIIPYHIVWGSRIKSDKEMYIFEIVSISINSFFLLIILVRSNILTIRFPDIFISIFLWIMTALFTLNTFGNILSRNKFEKIFFTPITIILTIFSLILALTK